MSASRQATKDVDQLVREVVGEEYQSVDEIREEVRARKGGRVCLSSVKNELECGRYEKGVVRDSDGELELFYREDDSSEYFSGFH